RDRTRHSRGFGGVGANPCRALLPKIFPRRSCSQTPLFCGAEAMILVLTYHKVVRGSEENPEFYSIRAEQLERHIELLHQHNFRILPPTELLNAKPQSGSSCVLSFDDATLDHVEIVKPVLERLSCRGLFFVPTAKLD